MVFRSTANPRSLSVYGDSNLRDTQKRRKLKEARMLNQVGKPAAPFELLDAEGTLHSLGDYAGKWLLLVFHRHLG